MAYSSDQRPFVPPLSLCADKWARATIAFQRAVLSCCRPMSSWGVPILPQPLIFPPCIWWHNVPLFLLNHFFCPKSLPIIHCVVLNKPLRGFLKLPVYCICQSCSQGLENTACDQGLSLWAGLFAVVIAPLALRAPNGCAGNWVLDIRVKSAVVDPTWASFLRHVP